MRAFIALELPDSLVNEVADMARALAGVAPGRYVPRANYHVTLAFLGEIGEDGARRAIDALEAACAGQPAPLLELDGLGTFGRDKNATLWVGVRATPEVMDLGAAVRAALDERGVSYDCKPFRPHITIARKVRLESAIPFSACDSALSPRVTLFRSYLDASGATYKPLYSVELASSVSGDVALRELTELIECDGSQEPAWDPAVSGRDLLAEERTKRFD